MWNVITPEEAGVASENVRKYVEILEKNHLSTHSVIMARGNSIFFEKYWDPFHANFLHRQYSVTKSFTALAIGFLIRDGLINIDDPIEKYFKKELSNQPCEYMHRQTIRHMLMMSTAKVPRRWFKARHPDRVQFYFDNDNTESRPSGTIFNYDSTGTFILGALCERLTGKKLMVYLREKLFDKIGVSKEAYILDCPGGHSWSDSALLMTARDLLTSARFTLNGGNWNGEQILDREYIKAATSLQITNDFLQEPEPCTFGYGYYFWITYENSYFFNGMGCQFAICIPHKDMILVINSDNQGRNKNEVIIKSFFDLIVDTASDEPLPGDPTSKRMLDEYTKDLKLSIAQGDYCNEFSEEINGKIYTLNSNSMGIKWICFQFGNDGKCIFLYENAQGKKELQFGLGFNEFGYFPQEGYSDKTGSVPAPGHKYRCAASGAWVESKKLHLQVQIIDNYFGRLDMTFSFRTNEVGIYSVKHAEDFLDEYEGFAGGILED